MDTDHMDGWDVQVYQALALPQALLIFGVPQTFFIINILTGVLIIMMGNMLYGVLWWRVAVVQLGLHAGAMLGTAYEVQWLGIVWRYLRYGAFYEG
jgi:hypothetical protein